MQLASLHTICLQRIYGLLRKDMWKCCITNPFSELPAQDVTKLMEITNLLDFRDDPRIAHVILLLTSGRLTRLDLISFHPILYEKDLILNVTQTRSVGLIFPNCALESEELFLFHLVRNVTSLNPCLEEFHSYIHPGFDVLRNCQNLRVLKFYLPAKSNFIERHVDLSVLSCLRNLETFHYPHMNDYTIADVLENCPKLISIGLTDSLNSIEIIQQRRLKNSSFNVNAGNPLQLQRCVWGKYARSRSNSQMHIYDYCDKVRSAVTLCPFVQELIFYVHVKEAMTELRFLKQLTLLSIEFEILGCDFVPELFALLQEIGPQLKHLSIIWNESTQVTQVYNGVAFDVIFDYCPNLESFETLYLMFDPIFSSEDSRNFHLKRLTLFSIYELDQENLLFLLSNCKNLEELFITEVESFDDALLALILEKNHFTELKVVYADSFNFTRRMYELFLEKVPSIERILITGDEGEYFYDINRAFKDPNIHYYKDFSYKPHFKDYFCRRLDRKLF